MGAVWALRGEIDDHQGEQADEERGGHLLVEAAEQEEAEQGEDEGGHARHHREHACC